MDKFTVPELLRCNLSSVILNLLHMKINPYVFDFMDKPPKEVRTCSCNLFIYFWILRIEYIHLVADLDCDKN